MLPLVSAIMDESSRRNRIIAVIVAIIIILILLFRCQRPKPVPVALAAPAPTPVQNPAAVQPAAPAAPGAKEPDEILTPATVQAPPQVGAGAKFSVTWTGPNNRGDYVTIVRQEAPAATLADYRDTKVGSTLQLTASIDPGEYEVRYVTGRSHQILGRAPVKITAATATLDAAAEVVLGSTISVAWTGPDNRGDFITLVPKDTPDGQYGNYTDSKNGSPLLVTAPPVAGEAELRYMTGQGNKVLGRRNVRIVMPDVTLSAPAEVVGGSTVAVTWSGPNNPGDFVTLVAPGTRDGEYGNYGYTRQGSPVSVIMPFLTGNAELRYMTGQGNKVLGRRPIRLTAPEVRLSAAAEAAAGSAVNITWTGPAYSGDYLTIVEKEKPDGQYGTYTNVRADGSPVTMKAPETAGAYEIRYMTGQGGKVLARRPIKIE